MEDLIELCSHIIEGSTLGNEVFMEKAIDFLANEDINAFSVEVDNKIFHALRISCRELKNAKALAKNEKAYDKLIAVSGFSHSEKFKFPEASKCLLNILHQIDEARKIYVKSSNYDRSLKAFKAVDSKNPELFFRLRHLFICTTELDGADKVVSEKLVPLIYSIAISLLEDIDRNKKDITELVSIIYNVSTVDRDCSNASLYIDFAGKMLDLESKEDEDLIKLKANSLNVFLNLSFESLQQPGGIGASFRLEKLIKLLEEIFNLPKEHRAKITFSGLYLAILNLCDAQEEVRKALRKYILPAEWDRHVKPELGPSIKSNLIRSMRGNNAMEARSAGNLILSLCNGQVNRMIYHIGYGNAAGFLYENNLLGKVKEFQQEPLDCTGAGHRRHMSSDEDDMMENNLNGINLITGEEHIDGPIENEMTEEEKIEETERVLDAMEKLEKLGFIKVFKQ